jgi:hypothetical protein
MMPLQTEPRSLTLPQLGAADRAELAASLRKLHEGGSVLVRLADLLGGAMGSATMLGLRRLQVSSAMRQRLRALGAALLERAYDIAIVGLDPPPRRHFPALRLAVATSGAVSGFAGLAGFMPDAGFTTLAIMRAIAEEARRQGEDLADPDTRRACLEVFAFGRPSSAPRQNGELPEGEEMSYFAARLFLQGRPMVALFTEIGARYGLRLSEKFAAQAVPVTGALLGAAINATFLAHYQNLARAHFTIRRLERLHGSTAVREAARM